MKIRKSKLSFEMRAKLVNQCRIFLNAFLKKEKRRNNEWDLG